MHIECNKTHAIRLCSFFFPFSRIYLYLNPLAWRCRTELLQKTLFAQVSTFFFSFFKLNTTNCPQISVHLQVHMYIRSDSASPDGYGALRLRLSNWRYIEIKAFSRYIMQVITMFLMIEPAGKYRIIFHIFWFKQWIEKLLLYSYFGWFSGFRILCTDVSKHSIPFSWAV